MNFAFPHICSFILLMDFLILGDKMLKEHNKTLWSGIHHFSYIEVMLSVYSTIIYFPWYCDLYVISVSSVWALIHNIAYHVFDYMTQWDFSFCLLRIMLTFETFDYTVYLMKLEETNHDFIKLYNRSLVHVESAICIINISCTTNLTKLIFLIRIPDNDIFGGKSRLWSFGM